MVEAQHPAAVLDVVRVLIVDDHDLFRAGLRTLLEEQEGVHVVGEASGGAQAVQLVSESAPDVVVMDLNMPGIEAAAVGESLISPTIAAKVLRRVRSSSSQPDIERTIRAELSDREIEVLKLIANGKDNAQIAADLHISPKTVKNHISNILMKLQIDNRIQAAVYAVRSGIV